MRFDIITLFPEIFQPLLVAGVTRRAFSVPDPAAQQGVPTASPLVAVRFWNPRDFAQGAYRRVDDRPFGGGPGMVMMAQPLADCLAAIREARGDGACAVPLVLFSPAGRRMDHGQVAAWSGGPGAILLCGRYEGIDQRFIDAHVDVQLSLGDFVLSGGEIAAMALLDAVARLQPGVLNDEGSHQLDSFNPALDGLLDCPHYTRPDVWAGQPVPDVLLSGHHGQIERWRRDQRVLATARARPDLLQAARAAGRLQPADEQLLAAQAKPLADQ